MPLFSAMPLVTVPPGSVAEFEASGAVYAICNVNGVVHCVDGTCPHAQGPLAEGALHDFTLVCPWHGWEFDVRTGAAEVGGNCSLRTYPAVVKDSQIFIDLPGEL